MINYLSVLLELNANFFGPFASNLEQVANLRCAQVNSASYPSRDREMSNSLRATG